MFHRPLCEHPDGTVDLCDVLLLDAPSSDLPAHVSRLPDHVCPGTQVETVRRYNRERCGNEEERPDLWMWINSCPTPYGAQTQLAWLRSFDGDGTLGARLAVYGETVPGPLLTDRDSRIALITRRVVEGVGTVTLMGTAVWDEARGRPVWVFAQPLWLVSYLPHLAELAGAPAAHDPFLHEKRHLWKWYRRRLLDKRAGPAEGSSKALHEAKQAIPAVMAELRGRDYTRVDIVRCLQLMAEMYPSLAGLPYTTFDTWLRSGQLHLCDYE